LHGAGFPEELLARLEKGKVIPAILLLGAEPYLRDACRAQLIETFAPEAARPWPCRATSPIAAKPKPLSIRRNRCPCFPPSKSSFSRSRGHRKARRKESRLRAGGARSLFGDPAPFTVLVLEAAGLDQRMKLAKLLMDKALVVEVGLGEGEVERQSAAVALAKAIGKEQAVEFEPGAAEDLAEFVAATYAPETEIEKLSTYAGERRLIRRQDVSVMVV